MNYIDKFSSFEYNFNYLKISSNSFEDIFQFL